MKIKLIKALKLKNRIVAKMQRTRELINSENRYIDIYDFEVDKLIHDNNTLIANLIELKTNLNKANQPIQEKIFQLSEIKNWLKNLQIVSVKQGTQKDRFENEATIWKVQMDAKKKESLVNDLQKNINVLQDDLDQFNATHSIDISFEITDY